MLALHQQRHPFSALLQVGLRLRGKVVSLGATDSEEAAKMLLDMVRVGCSSRGQVKVRSGMKPACQIRG